MNNPNNDSNNGQGYPQYSQNPQTSPPPQPRQTKGAVTGGEMFVGINLLSKIGVIFIIIGIIAFSAASEGFLHVGVRLALVIALGLLMLGAGELFYRTNSQVFANALIFGGVAELFICSLIGFHGFGILNGAGVVGIGLGAAVIGFLLSARYKSQGLLIVILLFSALPLFAELTSGSFCGAAVYLVAVHAAAAVFARKNNYTVAYMVGIAAAIVDTVLLEIPASNIHVLDKKAGTLIVVLFVICCAMCYAGGLLLDAAQEFGKLTAVENALLCIMLGAVIFYADSLLRWSISGVTAGIVLLVLAVIFAMIAVILSLHFGDDCTAVKVLFNFFFISVVLAVFDLSAAQYVTYVILHIFAAAALIAGLIFDRRLFRGWGYALIALSEIIFFGVLMLNRETGQRLFAIIVNLILWFGVMAAFIAKKKHQTGFFRAYTFAALLNAGILCSDMITRHLTNLLVAGEERNGAYRMAFSVLLCTVPWLILGFVVGKLKYMKKWKMVSSFIFYGIGLLCLLFANLINSFGSRNGGHMLGIAAVIATIAINAASVLPVLDITIQIREMEPKFAKAVGLIVSGYALLSLTTILGTNNYVTFTSFIISIIYIVMAAVWIVIGFKKLNALLRRFGLALALLSSAKLFLFDFSNINDMGRTLLFIGFGITLLCIAFGYGIAEKRLKDKGL